MKTLHMEKRDVVAFILGAIFVAAVIVLRKLGL